MTTHADIDWRTFTFEATEDKFDYIEDLVKDKTDLYLISYETTGKKGQHKPHFHVLFYIDKRIKFNLVKKVVDDLNLRSTGRGGKRKYASLDKNIPEEELDYFIQYLCKEQNIRSSGIDLDKLESIKEKAYKKTQQSKFRDHLYQELEKEDIFTKYLLEDSDQLYYVMKKRIVKFCIENEFNIPPNNKSLIINYLRITQYIELCDKVPIISNLIN